MTDCILTGAQFVNWPKMKGFPISEFYLSSRTILSLLIKSEGTWCSAICLGLQKIRETTYFLQIQQS